MRGYSRAMLRLSGVIFVILLLGSGLSVFLGAIQPTTVVVYVGIYPQDRNIILHDLRQGARLYLTRSANIEVSPVWSPDGSKVAYLSDQVDGIFRLYVWDFATGHTTALTPPERDQQAVIVGYTRIRWTRDSRYVVVTNPQTARSASRVVQVGVDGSTWRTLNITEAQPYLETLQREGCTLAPNNAYRLCWEIVDSQWQLLRIEGRRGDPEMQPLPTAFGPIDAPIVMVWEDYGVSLLVDLVFDSGQRGIFRLWVDGRPPELVVMGGITPDVRPR